MRLTSMMVENDTPGSATVAAAALHDESKCRRLMKAPVMVEMLLYAVWADSTKKAGASQ